MKPKILMLLVAAMMTCAAVVPAQAESKTEAVVKPFYTKILTRSSGADVAETAMEVLDSDWRSIGAYGTPAKTREKFVAQIQKFGEIIPDLAWNIEEMITDGNRVIVRGRAKGTPRVPMFGVDGQGRSFDIMSIDIHKVENGKIIESYHVEDWAHAMKQLKGK
ncbi:ester cyclase [Pelagibius sp. Alg239-R121]|uniref:ester cyclase n=1 Tax=Pelagibius sp. Alg239-R121 TaxID=2993448 RepID=UPI0024A6C7EC|nr:ester cyclase [Pelagibius sp. Alg239-R121]